MKTLRKLLIVIVGVFVSVQVFAQNSGTNPFVGSTHDYHVDKSTLTSDLTWTVTGGTQDVDYEFVGDVNTGEDIKIKWLTASATPYTLQVSEVRKFTATEIAGGAPASGCPTIRQISVTVEANTFDVYADLVTAAHDCAFVNSPVVDNDTAGDGSNLGDNSDDDFGTTTREYLITAVDAIGDWSYTYTLTHGGENVGDLKVNGVVYDASFASGKTITGINTPTQTITVTYKTNLNRQDQDFDLVFTVTGATDSLGTSDGDATAGKTDDATYKVYAVPATTGITTD